MRRKITATLMVVGIAIATAGPLYAQEAQEDQAPQRPPVFDLQPGPVREQPQPDVQGPRAPGMPAPRVIEDEPAPSQQSLPEPVAANPSVSAASEPSESSVADSSESATRQAPDAATRQLLPPTPATASSSATDVPAAVAQDRNPPSSSSSSLPSQADADSSQVSERDPFDAADAQLPPWWIWIAGLLAVAIAIGGIRIATNRPPPQRDEGLDSNLLAKVRPDPTAAPSANKAQPTASPQAIPEKSPEPGFSGDIPVPGEQPDAMDRPSRITVDFQPLSARLSTIGLTFSYRIDLCNVSDETLTDIAVRLGIRCAEGTQNQSKPEPEPPCVKLEQLSPGEKHVHTGVIRLDPETYRPMQSDGKPMLVPIVDMMPCYRDAAGVLHEMHAEMLVGRELKPPRQRMKPFWLEQGFGQFSMIGCRMLSITRA